MEFGRLDLAYTEYLTTTYIISMIIPKHKDAPEVAGNARMSATRKEIIRVRQYEGFIEAWLIRVQEIPLLAASIRPGAREDQGR